MDVYRKLKAPVCVQVEITSACNCRCSHCYNYWRPLDEKPQYMTKEVADKLIDVIHENEIKKVCLTGGEPFLNFDIFKYLTKKLQEIKVSVSTNTNLSAVSDEYLDFALQHNLRILTTVMGADAITHDGMTNAKGSFNRTVNSIKRCVAENNDVMVNIVVSKAISSKVYDIASFVARLGVKHIFVSVVICPEYAVGTDKEFLFTFNEDDVAEVLNSLLDVRDDYNVDVGTITTFPLCSLAKVRDVTPFMNRRCVAGRSELGINFEGKVSRCPQSGDYIGDLMVEDFKAIWAKADCTTSNSLPDVCINCPLFKMCSGGCRVSAKSAFGAWNAIDPKANPHYINSVIQNIKRHFKNLLVNEVSGYCRKECFGSIFIRNDGNYALLDKYFTPEELSSNDEMKRDIRSHIIPIVLLKNECTINQDCSLCELHDVCYNIHNCR